MPPLASLSCQSEASLDIMHAASRKFGLTGESLSWEKAFLGAQQPARST